MKCGWSATRLYVNAGMRSTIPEEEFRMRCSKISYHIGMINPVKETAMDTEPRSTMRSERRSRFDRQP